MFASIHSFPPIIKMSLQIYIYIYIFLKAFCTFCLCKLCFVLAFHFKDALFFSESWSFGVTAVHCYLTSRLHSWEPQHGCCSQPKAISGCNWMKRESNLGSVSKKKMWLYSVSSYCGIQICHPLMLTTTPSSTNTFRAVGTNGL